MFIYFCLCVHVPLYISLLLSIHYTSIHECTNLSYLLYSKYEHRLHLTTLSCYLLHDLIDRSAYIWFKSIAKSSCRNHFECQRKYTCLESRCTQHRSKRDQQMALQILCHISLIGIISKASLDLCTMSPAIPKFRLQVLSGYLTVLHKK